MLNQSSGHIPRHAKVYRTGRQADGAYFDAFRREVEHRLFPSAEHAVSVNGAWLGELGVHERAEGELE